MNINDARVWFRYRSKMTVRVKANRSSEFRNNMGCRHCNTDEVESQAHLETCAGTKDMRKDLDMTKENDHMIFWRKFERAGPHPIGQKGLLVKRSIGPKS